MSFTAALVLLRPPLNAITQLRNHAQALGSGKPTDFKCIPCPSEIKDLAVALDQMAAEVRFREMRLEEANREMESFSYPRKE